MDALYFAAILAGALLVFIAFVYALSLLFGFKEKMRIRRLHKALREEVAYLYGRLGQAGTLFQNDTEIMQRVRARQDIEKTLRQLLADIFRHMGLSTKGVSFHVVHSVFNSFEGAGRGGQFEQTSPGGRDIELMLRQDQSYWNIAAVLAHESAHCYMSKHDIHALPGHEEEQLTDILAVFLGFGRVLQKGYKPLARHMAGGTQTAKIGYLSARDAAYVRRVLKREGRRYRRQLARQQANTRQEEARRHQAQQDAARRQTAQAQQHRQEQAAFAPKVEAARRLYERLIEQVEAAKAGKGLCAEALAALPEMYRAIESGACAEQIEQAQSLVRQGSGIPAAAAKALDALLERIAAWSVLLEE